MKAIHLFPSMVEKFIALKKDHNGEIICHEKIFSEYFKDFS